MRAAGGVALATAVFACGAPSDAPSTPSNSSAASPTFRVVDGAPPPTEGASACTVSGVWGISAGDVQLLDSAGAPLARARASGVSERVELVDGEKNARARLDHGPIHLDGRVDVTAHPWVLAKRRTLIEGHLFAPSGVVLRIVGVEGAAVRAEVPGPFDAPKVITVPCASVAFDARVDEPRPKDPELAEPKLAGHALRVFDRPKGGIVMAEPVSGPLVVLEKKEGFAHVRIGAMKDTCEQGLVADGWVALADITLAPDPPDRDDACCSVLDSLDKCPNATVARTAELFVARADGDGPRHLGVAESRARVEVRSPSKGKLTPIELRDFDLNLPKGQALFIESGALQRTCDAVRADADDGCPCDP